MSSGLRTKNKGVGIKKKKGLIFVISGPSGSGKTTLVKGLLEAKEIRDGVSKSISFTTRPRRSGEKNRRDYFFISQERFKQLQKIRKVIEWTRYLGYYYATPKDFLETQLAKGKNLILCLDLKGALKLKRLYPKETSTIFIQPPSIGMLKERIQKRCLKTKKEEIEKRLKIAQEELGTSDRYGYHLINQDLDETIEKLKRIILRKIS